MLYNDKVVLRDFIKSDIEKRIYWETVETEWQMWDGPWEYENLTEKEKQDELNKYIDKMHKKVKLELPKDRKRNSFQITINNEEATYIGWCSSYTIDDEYNYSIDGKKCAIGIDLPEPCVRNRGYGSAALKLFINYLLEKGETAIYTQTWSGNIRMIALAKKLGFEECKREVNVRTVRGNQYDGLTFCLDMKKFKAICEKI